MPEIKVVLDEAWLKSITEGWIDSFMNGWWLYAIGLGLLIVSGNLFRWTTQDSDPLERFFDGDGGDGGGD